MANLDVFGIAANAFSVVGLADTVSRTSIQLYALYNQCRQATASKARVLAELKSLTSLAANVQIYLRQHEEVAGRDEESLSHVRGILILCRQELDILAKTIIETQMHSDDGWMASLSKSLKWTAREDIVTQSCQRLQRLCIELNAALSILNGRSMMATRADFTALSQKLDARIVALTSSAGSPRRAMCDTHHGPCKPRASKKGNRERSLLYNKTVKAAVICTSTSTPEEDLYQAGYAEMMDELRIHQLPNESLGILYEPLVLERITLPLMLLKTALIQGLQDFARSQPLVLPKQNQIQIQSVMNRVLAYCHTTSAAALLSSVQPDTLRQAGMLDPSLSSTQRCRSGRTSWLAPGAVDAVRTRSVQPSLPERRVYFRQEYSQKMPTGLVSARVDVGRDATGLTSEIFVLGFNLTFSPRKSISANAVSVYFISSELMSLLIPSVENFQFGLVLDTKNIAYSVLESTIARSNDLDSSGSQDDRRHDAVRVFRKITSTRRSRIRRALGPPEIFSSAGTEREITGLSGSTNGSMTFRFGEALRSLSPVPDVLYVRTL